MICPICNGEGVIRNCNGVIIRECRVCDGKGIVQRVDKPMTEQEYLQSCNTEQLVHVIHLMTTCCYVCGQVGVDYKRCYFHKKCTGPKEIEEWLKQPHTDKE